MSRRDDDDTAWSSDMSRNLRIHLARVGIMLDDPRAARTETPSPTTCEAESLDREAIELVLRANGAPARDIAWLVASCPSLEDAERFCPYSLVRRADT